MALFQLRGVAVGVRVERDDGSVGAGNAPGGPGVSGRGSIRAAPRRLVARLRNLRVKHVGRLEKT